MEKIGYGKEWRVRDLLVERGEKERRVSRGKER